MSPVVLNLLLHFLVRAVLLVLHRVETLRPDDSAAETQGHEHDERVTRDGHEVVRE